MLTVVDDCTRRGRVSECPGLVVDHSLPSARVAEGLDRLGALRGMPARLVCDDGPEFASRAFLGWARGRGIALDFIRPGKPADDACVENSNGELRDECLNEQFFTDLADARRTIERWRRHYNRARPHQGLGRRTPAEYAARLTPDPELRVLKQG